MTIENPPTCLWCGRPFKARTGGTRQTYCCPRHRVAFHTAARLWAERRVAVGLLTIDDLKHGPGVACTLVASMEPPSPLGDTDRADAALPDSWTRFLVEIPRGVIEALIFLHRDLPFDKRHDLREILAALDRLGRKPTVTRIG